MDKIDRVLNKVLKKISPGVEDRCKIEESTTLIKRKLESVLKDDAEVTVGGSIAKDTWIKGKVDVDIFVRFDYEKFSGKDISKILYNRLKKLWKSFEKLHGSRDYYQKVFRGTTFEIIPVLKIDDPKKAGNITDISPLHAEWVKRHKKYNNDIRLAKAFAKAQDLYGAESYIKGFSGYVLEILVVYYKGFKKFIRSASRWKPNKVFDIEKHHKDVFKELNESKLQSPIIVIDPVQPGRNAAAALSLEKFNLLVEKADDFIKNPSESFFVKKQLTLSSLRKKAGNHKLVLLRIFPKRGKQDVVGSKLLKAYDHIRKHLVLNNFNVLESGWQWDKKDKCLFWYILENDSVSRYLKWIGPPVKNREHAKRFVEKYKNAKVDGKKLVAIIKRKYTKANDMIKDILKSKYLKEKIKEAKLR